MTRNVYDNSDFFESYSTLNRSVHGLAGAPEWPVLRAMLPDIRNLRVIDLGCGFGWFCRWVREQGAAHVAGFDVSANMLARAASLTDDPTIAYTRADLEELVLDAGSCDLAYSSLALHYVANLDRLLATVHRALIPGGRLVFSVEHPIFTAPRRPGWSADAQGRKSWLVNAYADEGPRIVDWLGARVVKRHRTFGGWIDPLLHCGFSILEVRDFSPTHEQVAAQPMLAEDRERPMFLLVSARR